MIWFWITRETLVQFGFDYSGDVFEMVWFWITREIPYISRVRTTSPESAHTPPEEKIPRETYQTLTWLYLAKNL